MKRVSMLKSVLGVLVLLVLASASEAGVKVGNSTRAANPDGRMPASVACTSEAKKPQVEERSAPVRINSASPKRNQGLR